MVLQMVHTNGLMPEKERFRQLLSEMGTKLRLMLVASTCVASVVVHECRLGRERSALADLTNEGNVAVLFLGS